MLAGGQTSAVAAQLARPRRSVTTVRQPTEHRSPCSRNAAGTAVRALPTPGRRRRRRLRVQPPPERRPRRGSRSMDRARSGSSPQTALDRRLLMETMVLMEPNQSKPPAAVTAKTVAAIDVGANALRMVIAEVFSDGRIEVLERLQRAVRLGQDTFRRGRLGGESMRAAVQVLRDYRQLLDLYKVEKVRAVATTAVREAANGDTFLDRVFMATRLNVEVIDTSEESRLTVSAVRQAVGDALGVNQRQTLIADVGGGSTLLTLLENGEIATSQSLRLGSIRLQEVFSTSEESPQRSADLLRQHITNALATLQSVSLEEIDSFVAVGATPASPPEKSAPPPNRPTWRSSTRPSSTSSWIVASDIRPKNCRNATACPSPRPKPSIRPCWSTRSSCTRPRPSR